MGRDPEKREPAATELKCIHHGVQHRRGISRAHGSIAQVMRVGQPRKRAPFSHSAAYEGAMARPEPRCRCAGVPVCRCAGCPQGRPETKKPRLAGLHVILTGPGEKTCARCEGVFPIIRCEAHKRSLSVVIRSDMPPKSPPPLSGGRRVDASGAVAGPKRPYPLTWTDTSCSEPEAEGPDSAGPPCCYYPSHPPAGGSEPSSRLRRLTAGSWALRCVRQQAQVRQDLLEHRLRLNWGLN